MMLDQQYPMEHAFRGPGGRCSSGSARSSRSAIAARGPGGVRGAVRRPAGRAPVSRVDGGADPVAGQDRHRRVRRRYRRALVRRRNRRGAAPPGCRAFPGFGKQKAQIFVSAARPSSSGSVREGWERGGRRLRRGGLPVGGRRGRRGVAAQGARASRRRRKPRPSAADHPAGLLAQGSRTITMAMAGCARALDVSGPRRAPMRYERCSCPRTHVVAPRQGARRTPHLDSDRGRSPGRGAESPRTCARPLTRPRFEPRHLKGFLAHLASLGIAVHVP